MEDIGLNCQVCLRKHTTVFAFKKHVQSTEHQKKMEELFPNDELSGHGFFPHIVFINPRSKYDRKTHNISLCLLTLCVSPPAGTCFYLCHVCEDKRPSEKILHHLLSSDHCINYFSYIDPNALSFSWIPNLDMKVFLRPEITKEAKETRNTLQILDLPADVMERVNKGSYSEVMCILRENDKLFKLLEAVKPMRTMIQPYQRNSNREHPLLGMQHIVECICVGSYENRHYLCTLCKLTMGSRAVIKHVLSFDHIFSYFKAWHPSTLLAKESYIYSNTFAFKMLNLAKQTEEIHGSENTVKQVDLEPAEFTSVNFKSYAEALKKLESLTKDREGSSLVANIRPGNKLEVRSRRASVPASVPASAPIKAPASAPTSVPIKEPASVPIKEPASVPIKAPASAPTSVPIKEPASVPAESVAPSYKLRCLDCSFTFRTLSQYLQHVSQSKHGEMLKEVFKQGSYGIQKAPVKLSLDLHSYLQEALKLNKPVVGASLVVAFVSSQVQAQTIYICFACEECFPETSVRQHMECDKHVLHTLLYQNPWKLPFAWKNYVESMKVLRAAAWEEEKQRGPEQMVVKVLDIPNNVFQSSAPPNYPSTMESLKFLNTLLKKEVPQCETDGKPNGRFPLLGKQFLVTFDKCVISHHSMEMTFPCLLCERRLYGYEIYAHVFSWEHVQHFLDRFHPGSLSSNTDTETMLDLAKQAACIHPVSKVQEIKLDKPIWEPCAYSQVIFILASVKRRHGGGKLEPSITPKQQLFPRGALKETDQTHVTENSEKQSWKTEGSDWKTSQTSAGDSENSPENSSAEPGSGFTGTCCSKGEKKADAAHTETQSDTQSEKITEVVSKACPDEVEKAIVEPSQWIKQEKTDEIMEEVKTAHVETSQWIKQEKMDEIMEKVKEIKKEITVELMEIKDENIKVSPWAITECSPNPDNSDRAETGEECEGAQTCMHKKSESKRANCTSEDVDREMEPKRQKLTSTEDSPCKGPRITSSRREGEKPLTTLVQRESGKLSHDVANVEGQLWQHVKKSDREPVVGLDALLECVCDQRDPIYLCKCCSLKLPGPNIVSHVSGLDHQRMYLLGTQKLPPPTGNHKRDKMRHLAFLFEQDKGYGDAQVIQLSEDDFERFSKQSFYSAMQTIKALLAQQDNRHELSLTSALPASQPEPVSVTVHANLELYSRMDTAQVIIMDIDSETKPSSETAPVSLMAESTEDASSPHVSKSGTNAASLHCHSTLNNSKDRIAPDTAMKRLKTLTSPKVGGTPHAAKTSHSTITTHKCTPDYTRSLATVHKLTASTPSCTRATATLGEATHRCTAAKSGAAATTTKPTTPAVCTAASSRYAAASSTLTGSTSTPNTSISRMASTAKSTTSTKPREIRPEAATKATATSSRPLPASQTGSTLVHKTARGPKYSKTALNCTVIPQTAGTAAVTQTSRTFEYIKASAKTVHAKNPMRSNVDAAPRVPKSNPPPDASVRPEHKNPPAEPSQGLTNKGNKNTHRLGLDEVITVTSGNKKQIYCQLCSVRLNESSHLTSRSHVYQCVKKKYSGFLPDMLESPNNWAMVVANLAELERKCGNRRGQTIEVTDDVYNELRDPLDAKTAIEKLNVMLNQAASPSTKDTPESLRPKPNPCEASGLDDVPAPDHEQLSASGGLPAGERNEGRSYLSTHFSARQKDSEPIIGLDKVWECQGISGDLFFLCESCEATLSVHSIFPHLVNTDHVLKYMWRCHPHFMVQFWPLKDLDEEFKFKILKGVVGKLLKRDVFHKRALLGPELFDHVWAAPFSEALHMVTRIKTEEEQRVWCPPASAPQQSDKYLPTRKRPVDTSVEALVTVNPQLVNGSLALHHEPRCEPASEYTVNPAATTLVPVSGEEKETGPGCGQERAKWSSLAGLIKLVMQMKSDRKLSLAPGNADATTSCDNTSESGAGGKWASRFEQAGAKIAEKASQCDWLEATLKNAPLQSNPTTGSAGVCQLPVKTITPARLDHANQQLIGGSKRREHVEDAHSLATREHLNPGAPPAAPGGYGRYGQKAFLINGQPVSESVSFCTTPEKPPVYPQGLYQQEVLYPALIHPEQESRLQAFGHVFTMPTLPGRLSLDTQQQQQQQQQQCSPLAGATLATAVGNGTTDAVGLGAAHFSIPANNSRRLTDLSACSGSGVVPQQGSSNLKPQYFYQVYNRPPAFQSPPSSRQ